MCTAELDRFSGLYVVCLDMQGVNDEMKWKGKDMIAQGMVEEKAYYR